jgi:hypothetical protein
MVLLFWLKGVGCVVCCTTEIIKPLCHITETSISKIEVPSNESQVGESDCSERDCCGQPVKKSFASVSASSNDEATLLQLSASADLKVCSLLASQTLAFTVSSKSIAPPVAEMDSPYVLSANIPQANNLYFTQTLELRNRSGTYLHCCVLLI